jgi:hypothetical protein
VDIRMLWGKRPEAYPGEYAPELMLAWDEYCLDDNEAGYQEAKAAAIKSWGSDFVQGQEIVISIPDDALNRAFEFPRIVAAVYERGSERP